MLARLPNEPRRRSARLEGFRRGAPLPLPMPEGLAPPPSFLLPVPEPHEFAAARQRELRAQQGFRMPLEHRIHINNMLQRQPEAGEQALEQAQAALDRQTLEEIDEEDAALAQLPPTPPLPPEDDLIDQIEDQAEAREIAEAEAVAGTGDINALAQELGRNPVELLQELQAERRELDEELEADLPIHVAGLPHPGPRIMDVDIPAQARANPLDPEGWDQDTRDIYNQDILPQADELKAKAVSTGYNYAEEAADRVTVSICYPAIIWSL